MAKTRGWLADLMSKFGCSIFKLISRWEDRGALSRTARWFKLSLLGLFVTLVGALSLEANDDIILCYVPVPRPHMIISDVSLKPNPTSGRDTVTVKATAKIVPLYYEEDSTISRAFMRLGDDTLRYSMRSLDGKFGDTLEIIEGSFYVGNLEPETTWIYIDVGTSSGLTETKYVELIISEPEADSTTKKEE